VIGFVVGIVESLQSVMANVGDVGGWRMHGLGSCGEVERKLVSSCQE